MDRNKSYHKPVLLDESLILLQVQSDGVYVDCTLGEGGHSFAIFNQLGEKGTLTSFDHDSEAIQYVKQKYKEAESDKWKLINDNFSNISRHLKPNSVNGILMDLGISSRHLEIPGRGFSYKMESDPLDMRMDPSLNVTASDLINVLDQQQLAQLFFKYGEERFGNAIARSIKSTNVNSVGDLNHAISRALPAASSKYDTFRRIYQALRIAVNTELQSLEQGLAGAFDALDREGRLVVISFHSLEDRIVKQFFKRLQTEGSVEILTPKPITPSEEELERNSRSHSAKLRAVRKL